MNTGVLAKNLSWKRFYWLLKATIALQVPQNFGIHPALPGCWKQEYEQEQGNAFPDQGQRLAEPSREPGEP